MLLNPLPPQELVRYRALLEHIRTSLSRVLDVVLGRRPLTEDAEEVMQAILAGRTPGLWLNKSYASCKSLAAYVSDLVKRWVDVFSKYY